MGGGVAQMVLLGRGWRSKTKANGCQGSFAHYGHNGIIGRICGRNGRGRIMHCAYATTDDIVVEGSRLNGRVCRNRNSRCGMG